MIYTILIIALLACLIYISHLKGVLRGQSIESANSSREWMDGFNNAKSFYAQPEEAKQESSPAAGGKETL